MKILIPALILAFISQLLFAQEVPIILGVIPIEDLKASTYPKDTSASAVVLADYGESSIVFNEANGFMLEFERIARIKILTKGGLDYATFEVPLYKDGGIGEKITSVKGTTYNLENNRVVETKMQSDAVFREKATKHYDIMKFTLPAVKVGSVIEISYKVISNYLFHLQDWEFQNTIPVRWSEYRANIPDYFHYDQYTQGYVPLSIVESKEVGSYLTVTSAERLRAVETISRSNRIDFVEKRYRWVAKDVPAFKPEPFITTPKDYITKISFELIHKKFPLEPIQQYMGSWEDLNRTLSDSEYFGKQIRGNSFLKKIVDQITTGLSSAEQKMVSIHRYVTQNVEWNGLSNHLSDATFKKLLEEKKGTSADINLLLASMLDKAGFNARGVLVSTRDHGFVKEKVPVSSQFNYVVCIVKLNDELVLLDATDKLLPAGTLPERCLNGQGFVIAEDGEYGWVPLRSPNKSRKYFNAELAIGGSAELRGKIQLEQTGYYGQSSRKAFTSKGEQQYVKDLVDNRSWIIESSEFKNIKEISESFSETHHVVINDQIISSGDLMYVNPLVGLQEKENPFKLEDRKYPVDYGSPIEKLYVAKISIPDGYAVDEMPKNVLLILPNNKAKYAYSLVRSGNSLSLTSNLQINSSLFIPEEYPNLREFYAQVVAKQAEQIVFKKK